MKQSSVDERTVKITQFPCTTIEPCLEGEEDPCADCHDVTEKDLEILSKVEAATLKAGSKAKQEQGKESGERKWDKEKVGKESKREGGEGKIQKDDERRRSKDKAEKNSKQEGGESKIQKDDDRRWSNEKAQRNSKQEGGGKSIQKEGPRNSKQEGGERKIQEDDDRRWSNEKDRRNSKQEGGGKIIQTDNRRNSKSNIKRTDESRTKGRRNFDSGRKTVGDDDNDTSAATATSTVKLKRKTCHKKVKKSPFHRDRLGLPFCVSPPPRFPPPQLHPPADEFEEVECPKPRKAKPCRKKTGIREIKTKNKEKSKNGVKLETEKDVTGERYYEETGEEQGSTEKERTGEETKKGDGRSVTEIKPETETTTKAETSEKKIEEVERRTSEAKPMERSGEGAKPTKFVSRNRKPCMRRIQKPCKKKVSAISVSLLPPLIPPLQRDLPSISPKNIPEVKRQTLMAAENKRAVERERCKRLAANKAKNK